MNEGLVDDDARNRTRLSLIDEAGWSHVAHDSRDFVFVEGELCFFSSSCLEFVHLEARFGVA